MSFVIWPAALASPLKQLGEIIAGSPRLSRGTPFGVREFVPALLSSAEMLARMTNVLVLERPFGQVRSARLRIPDARTAMPGSLTADERKATMNRRTPNWLGHPL